MRNRPGLMVAGMLSTLDSAVAAWPQEGQVGWERGQGWDYDNIAK